MVREILKNLLGKKRALDPRHLPLSAEEALRLFGGKETIDAVFSRSIRIRQVDAGSCNACEWECTALTNPVYDVTRFGIDFVASPRHADVLLVTGPVTRQMELALNKTYLATPEPRFVIACGDCAINGGIYRGSYAVTGGVEQVIPIDLAIPGCPPTPSALMRGLLEFMGRPVPE